MNVLSGLRIEVYSYIAITIKVKENQIEKLAKLRAVMGGVSTAGNSSTENDGAAAGWVLPLFLNGKTNSHRKDAENAERFIFLFSGERQENKIPQPFWP